MTGEKYHRLIGSAVNYFFNSITSAAAPVGWLDLYTINHRRQRPRTSTANANARSAHASMHPFHISKN